MKLINFPSQVKKINEYYYKQENDIKSEETNISTNNTDNETLNKIIIVYVKVCVIIINNKLYFLS